MYTINSKKEAEYLLPEVVSWRRSLHQCPEIKFSLTKTVAFITEKLDEFDIPYKKDVGCPSSIIAEIVGKQPGKTIALRADMDALPIKEETNLPFAAKNNAMHACGHDAHTAMLLGTAKLLKAHENALPGKVVLVFQPAEETGNGAECILSTGVLDDVEEIIGLHAGHLSNEGEAGDLLFREGSMMAGIDHFLIQVQGRGAHGAAPEKSCDPITAAAQIVVSLQQIVSREVSPHAPAVVTIGSFHAGNAFNIIPDTATLEGTVRTMTREDQAFIRERIISIAKGIGNAFRTKVSLTFVPEPPPLINDADVTRRVMAAARDIYPRQVKEMVYPVMSGEDFALYLQKIPGTFFFLRNPLPIEGRLWPHHNTRFAIDEQYLDRGIAVFLHYILMQQNT